MERRSQPAAKFLSAEEVAAQRQQELSMISNKTATLTLEDILPSPTEGSMTETVIEEQGATASSEGRTGNVELQEPWQTSLSVTSHDEPSHSSVGSILQENKGTSAETPVQTPVFVTPRKNAVLDRADANVINCLNRMLSSTPHATPARSVSRGPSRRMSIAVTGSTVSGGGVLFMEKEGDKVSAPPRSRCSLFNVSKRLGELS
ncbi:hypothetical protein EON65_43375, partial [archaeon]